MYEVDDTAYEHIQYDDGKYAQYVHTVKIFYNDVYEINYSIKLYKQAMMIWYWTLWWYMTHT